MGRYHVSVDTGGTFSDFVLFEENTQDISIFKVPSTPKDPGQAILNGLRRMVEQGIKPEDVSFFSHGTTVGTNALLEDKGVKTGLLITEGFRGIYEVGEQTRGYGAATFELDFEKPKMLAPQRLTEEVRERVESDGTVRVALDEQHARERIRALKARGVASIAVCLLFGYLNPEHEKRLKELIGEELPGCAVSLASEVLPQIREYYRLSTTVINAYLSPIMQRYLTKVDGELDRLGLRTGQKYVMQSNGGVTTFATAAERAVTTLLSGPAGGVTAGARTGQLAGFDEVITFDMGGTSCDVALVERGVPVQAMRSKIGERDVGVPMVEMNTVSAGGGTIAWLDSVGDLKVGPHSAGADPGPVAYGRGGTEPTITDADVVLGFIDPDNFLGGEMVLDREKAELVLTEKIARPLGLDVFLAAEGIFRIVNARMGEAIKAISSAKGYDLRDFALISFGGAGAIHAPQIAAELGIPRVVVPLYPGVTSAMGLLMSDVKRDYVRSKLGSLESTAPAEVSRMFAELAREASDHLFAEGFGDEEISLEPFVDMRYAGQGYELTIPAPGVAVSGADLRTLREAFDDTHERLFGHRAEKAPVDIVSYRLTGWAKVPQLALSRNGESAKGGAPPPKRHRPVYFKEVGEPSECPVFDREDLRAGDEISGPAIIEQADSTTVIYPRQRASIDVYRNIVVEVPERTQEA